MEELAKAIIREVDIRDGRPPRETFDDGLLATIQLRGLAWLREALDIRDEDRRILWDRCIA